MRVRSPKPGWLYVRLAWRRQLGRFNRWSPPPARPCQCLRCQRKRDAQGRVAAGVVRLRHAFLHGAPGFRPSGPRGGGIAALIGKLEAQRKLKGTAIRDMLCPANVTRTRTGAWLVKGRGPTRRYSRKIDAWVVACARNSRYADEHRVRP